MSLTQLLIFLNFTSFIFIIKNICYVFKPQIDIQPECTGSTIYHHGPNIKTFSSVHNCSEPVRIRTNTLKQIYFLTFSTMVLKAQTKREISVLRNFKKVTPKSFIHWFNFQKEFLQCIKIILIMLKPGFSSAQSASFPPWSAHVRMPFCGSCVSAWHGEEKSLISKRPIEV